MTLTTEGGIFLNTDELDGDCQYFGFSIREGEASNGAQQTFEAEECRLLVTVERVEASWELVFEPLR